MTTSGGSFPPEAAAVRRFAAPAAVEVPAMSSTTAEDPVRRVGPDVRGGASALLAAGVLEVRGGASALRPAGMPDVRGGASA
ncbi:hypothetical protein ACQP0C_38645 [Nocardia sp. CA-129566]|uniref:hypothetical protein n=1 Tax=Nocardia sp. CA-129566 TaxID=3239976 RepID=UPI003D980149